jgi:hypothetical protein
VVGQKKTSGLFWYVKKIAIVRRLVTSHRAGALVLDSISVSFAPS